MFHQQRSVQTYFVTMTETLDLCDISSKRHHETLKHHEQLNISWVKVEYYTNAVNIQSSYPVKANPVLSPAEPVNKNETKFIMR